MKPKITLFAFMLLLMLSSVSALSTSNYIQYLSFDTDYTDSSTNGYDATNGGTSITGSGVLGSYLDTDGTDYVDTNIDSEINGETVLTFHFWAKYTGTGILSWGADGDDRIEFDFNVAGEGLHRGYTKVGNVVKIQSILDTDQNDNDGSWHFHIIEFDTTTGAMNWWIDNTLIADTQSASLTGAFATLSNSFYLGGFNKAATDTYVHIDYDEFGIYAGSFDTTDRSDLYNSGAGLNPFLSTGANNFTITTNGRFSAKIDNTFYNSTDGQIVTHILQNDTSLYDITISPNDFALNKTFSSYNVSSNLDYNFTILQIDAEDAYSAIAINTFDITINSSELSYTETKNTASGTLNFSLINGSSYTTNFNTTGYTDANYTFSNFQNHTNYTYSVYAANSILLNIYNATSNELITNTVTILTTFNESLLFSNTTTSGSIFFTGLDQGSYSFTISSTGFENAIYIGTVGNNTFQTISVYLQPSTDDNVIFRVVDKLTDNDLEGATVSVETKINGSYVLTSSYLTDLTGRIQSSYIPDTDYRFTVSFTNYTTKIFELTPIIFSSYKVQLERVVTEQDDSNFANVNIVISPDNLYNGQINNITLQITSPEGYLVGYSYRLYSDVNATNITGSGTNSYGGIFNIPYNLSNASTLDRIYLHYSYSLSSGSQKNYTKVWTVTNPEGILGALIDNAENPYNIPLFDRVFIVVVIMIFAAGIAFLFTGLQGAAIVSILIMGYFPAVGIVPLWVSALSIITLVVILMRSST